MVILVKVPKQHHRMGRGGVRFSQIFIVGGHLPVVLNTVLPFLHFLSDSHSLFVEIVFCVFCDVETLREDRLERAKKA